MTNLLARRILLIGDDAGDAGKIGVALAAGQSPAPILEWVRQLSEGLERLKASAVDVILVDLFLPDCQGLQTFDELWRVASDIPMLVICDSPGESLALEAVERGARDYLLKTHLDAHSFRLVLRQLMDGRAAADALFIERHRAEVTLNSIGDAVLSTDATGNITYLNPVAERITGWSMEQAQGRPLNDVFKLLDGTNPESSSILIRQDGVETIIENSSTPMHDRSGGTIGAVIVFRDLSAVRAMTLQMSYLAHHDALTNLPNRLLLQDRLIRALELGRRHRRPLAVLFVDLDEFKQVNDSVGHDVGDDLLRSVAGRITECLRSSDTISRPGSDEFVVVLPEIEHANHAAISVRKILAAVAQSHRIAGHDLHVTASIGVSAYPADGQDAETLLKRAEMAMHRAKQRERGGFQFFHPEMNSTAVERMSIERGLRRALDQQEFVLHYQPKMDLESGAIIGVEALIRWHHPDWGLLPPSWFVPIAEDSGLIVQIGHWVLHEACRQTQAWHDAGLRTQPVAVNVSAIEFRSTGFVEGVRKVLEETRLQPSCLGLELTETVLMSRGPSTLGVLQELKALGVSLSLDDFGTGFSSLTNLKEFPIDALKVDQSFVRGIGHISKGAPIVRAVINLGKSLNHRVIAEGVETTEEVAFLRTEGCDEAQGYYFSRPLPAVQYAKLAARGRVATES